MFPSEAIRPEPQQTAAERHVADDPAQGDDLTAVRGVGRDAADPRRARPAEDRGEGPDVALDIRRSRRFPRRP